MLDPHDEHPMIVVVESVDDAVRTALGGAVAGELTLERSAHRSRLLEERAEARRITSAIVTPSDAAVWSIRAAPALLRVIQGLRG